MEEINSSPTALLAVTYGFMEGEYFPHLSAWWSYAGVHAGMVDGGAFCAAKLSMKNWLKVLRAERGWTQAQLADAVGVARQTIVAMEKGKYSPSLELAFKFSKVGEGD